MLFSTFFSLLLIRALLKLIFLARDKETIDKTYVAIALVFVVNGLLPLK